MGRGAWSMEGYLEYLKKKAKEKMVPSSEFRVPGL